MLTKKRLFFDIETSFNIGIFWRSGYNLSIQPEDIIHERAIICISWKWEGSDDVHTLSWDKDQSDKKLLQKFIKVLNQADEIVAHNGDRFDIKWLRTRCLFHNLPMFPKYQSIDTLKFAKSQFNFNSNKLDYIAKFLGVGAKTKHEGMDMWKKIIFNKDPEALKMMIEYCENDVVILENVYNKIKEYTTPKVNYAVLNGGDKYECPECGSSNPQTNKTYTTTMGVTKHHMRCNVKSCGTTYTISNKTYIDLLKYKVLSKNYK
jgi:hypothetical protein